MAYPIDSTTWVSPNYDDRTRPISSIVVHSCEGAMPFPRLTSLPWLCNPQTSHPERRVSCHYYVCRDTTIFQLVDDQYQAWHVGNAEAPFVNNVSLGIELEHHAGQVYPFTQKAALAWLLRTLANRYTIPARLIETHGQVAIRGPYQRKRDPSDWPHGEFLLFVGRALADENRTVTAGPFGAIAQQDRRPGAPAARFYAPDTIIHVDDLTNDYYHTVDHAGFIPAGQVLT